MPTPPVEPERIPIPPVEPEIPAEPEKPPMDNVKVTPPLILVVTRVPRPFLPPSSSNASILKETHGTTLGP
ncbi:hypothetical protein TNCV_3490441 [Trichonephila clavipes]|nr:hypothetical protein TNCV_3490441 [Trichonephila clavipes]